jgi:hypothetical protein
MAPLEIDSDNRVSTRKNLYIVFLLLTAENSNPNSTWHHRDRLFRLQTPRTAAGSQPKALVNAAKFTATRLPQTFCDTNNSLILQHYFPRRGFSRLTVANKPHGLPGGAPGLLISLSEKCRSPGPAVCVFWVREPIRRAH